MKTDVTESVTPDNRDGLNSWEVEHVFHEPALRGCPQTAGIVQYSGTMPVQI